MKTNDGKMVASKAPRRIRAMSKPVKLVAAVVHMVTIDHEMKLNMTQYFTGQSCD